MNRISIAICALLVGCTQTGPRGPEGPAGPQGIQGVQGPSGSVAVVLPDGGTLAVDGGVVTLMSAQPSTVAYGMNAAGVLTRVTGPVEFATFADGLIIKAPTRPGVTVVDANGTTVGDLVVAEQTAPAARQPEVITPEGARIPLNTQTGNFVVSVTDYLYFTSADCSGDGYSTDDANYNGKIIGGHLWAQVPAFVYSAQWNQPLVMNGFMDSAGSCTGMGASSVSPRSKWLRGPVVPTAFTTPFKFVFAP